ncbi:MAG: nitrogen regulation protein NR(II) [Thioalkalivibrionaceae bacterium]
MRRAPALPATAFDEMSIGVLWLDDQCRVLGLNATAEMLLGVSRSRAVNTALHELLGLNEPLTHNRPPAETMGLRNIHLHPPRSKSFLADVVMTPAELDNRHGLLVELLPLDRARRIAEDEQSERQQQLSREILRGFAHEIRNPLGGMRGAAQLLQVELAESSLVEYTTIVLREVDRLVAMVDRMLGPNQAPQRIALNVHEVLEHVLSLIRLELPESLRVVRDYDPSIPDITVDRDMLIQATLNLVRNAVQAMGGAQGEGRLSLITRVLRHHTVHGVRHRLVALLRVGDDGPGVAEHLHDRIFFPMVSGRADGSGLGLSIAQRLVQLNGGVIEFRSRPRKTEFDILIPIQPESAV